MSPLNLIPGGPKAAVDLGYGAHDPQLHIDAPDRSCAWEDFPVALVADPFVATTPSNPATSSQLSSYATPASAGPHAVPAANWPFLWAFDYLGAYLAGYRLEVRISGSISGNSAQVAAVNAYGGTGYADPTYHVGAFDTGWQAFSGPDCAQAATAPNGDVYLQVVLRQFNPLLVSQIDGGVLQARWVSSGGAAASWEPLQRFAVVYGPPGGGARPAGLTVNLETNSCGVLTKTYTQVKAAIDAAGLGFTVTLPGSHGADVAGPDSDVMGGADCSGGVRRKTAVRL